MSMSDGANFVIMVKPSLTGVVVSQGKMNKTIKIRIKKLKWNNVVSKYVVDYKNMLVHDELNKCREGDVVRIQYVRPLSARKSWAVAEIMKLKGTSWQKYLEVIPAEVRQDELAKLEKFRALRLERQRTNGEDAVVAEMRELEAALNDDSGAGAERVAELKEKYNISEWPPAAELVKLDLSELESQIDALNQEINGTQQYSAEARRLLAEEPSVAEDILRQLGKDPSVLKTNVKRNMLLQHLRRQS